MAVVASDPEQAILDRLAEPVGVWEPGPVASGGWRSGFMRGGSPEQADLSTVRFIKHRQSAQRHAYYVTFDGTHPAFGERTMAFRYAYVVQRDPDGGAWHVGGSTGGAGDPPRRGTPWVNLGGGGWPNWFFAGGQIDPAAAKVDRVELRFANGLVLCDDASESVALFISDEPVRLPATVVMLDEAGAELASHSAFPGT